MIQENNENEVSEFQVQFQYRAQALFQYHQYCAKQSESDLFQSYFDSYLSMVSKVGDHFCLSNPYFPIEECLNSLYNLISPIRVINSFLPDYKAVASHCPPPVIKKKARDSPELTLVLDLDETLVHSSSVPITKDDLQISINDGMGDSIVKSFLISQCYVSVRPFALEFLKEASKHFEVIIFTAAEQHYADKVIDLLDPERKFIKHRLYRNSCMAFNSLFVKDLNVLGRDLAKTVIVDNSPSAFAFHVKSKFKLQENNAILIRSYVGDETDEALTILLDVLKTLYGSKDARSSLARCFKGEL